MRKFSETVGKSLTKRRTESVDFPPSALDTEHTSQSSSDEFKSRDSIEIARPQSPDKKGQAPRPPGPEPLAGRLSSNETPASPSTGSRHLPPRLSLSNETLFHDEDGSDGKSKFRSNIKRLSLKSLSRSKSDQKKADKRVMHWVQSFPQFAVFAPKFAFTSWEQLLTYTSDDLNKLGLPAQAVVPLSKIIAVLAEESAMEKAWEKEATALPYALLQVPDPRPRSFSYNNRAIATSEHVKTLEELFQELDTDHRGVINESELSVALKRYGVVDQEGAKAWFADIDSGQRGVIDQQQFVDFMTYVYPMIFQTSNPAWSPRSGGGGEPPTIFLGGSCNPTSWRKDIVIPLLQKASISYFNPQVEEWHDSLIAIEARAKASATLLFFVIDSLTLSLATMIECTELILSGRPLVLVINDLPADAKLANGEPMPRQVLRDANRARAYMADVAVRHRISPYSSISRAACELIQFLHGGWTGGSYESRPRATLAKKSEESWTALKHKLQLTIAKMNAGRRGSLRGSQIEPSTFSLPPPRTPERPSLQQRPTAFEPNLTSMPSDHSSASSSSKMTPLSFLGNFPHLAVSPSSLSRQFNHTRSASLSNGIPASAVPLSSSTSMGTSAPRSSECGGLKSGKDTSAGGVRASISSLTEFTDLEDLATSHAKTNSISSLTDIVEPLKGPVCLDRPKTDSPRFSCGSNLDSLNESPTITPLSSLSSNFLSFSPGASPTTINRTSFA